LNVQLNELEAHDLIKKKVFAVVPPKVEYSLTPFGKTIIPIIGALGKDNRFEVINEELA
jgi:DNA-binding HxlR family transcriptional regulator